MLRRTLIVGWREGVVPAPEFPPLQAHESPHAGATLPPWRTVRLAIGDLGEPTGTEIGTEPPLDLHFGRNPTPKSLRRYVTTRRNGRRIGETEDDDSAKTAIETERSPWRCPRAYLTDTPPINIRAWPVFCPPCVHPSIMIDNYSYASRYRLATGGWPAGHRI